LSTESLKYVETPGIEPGSEMTIQNLSTSLANIVKIHCQIIPICRDSTTRSQKIR